MTLNEMERNFIASDISEATGVELYEVWDSLPENDEDLLELYSKIVEAE